MRNYRTTEKEPGHASRQPSATRAVLDGPRLLRDRTVRHHRRLVANSAIAPSAGPAASVEFQRSADAGGGRPVAALAQRAGLLALRRSTTAGAVPPVGQPESVESAAPCHRACPPQFAAGTGAATGPPPPDLPPAGHHTHSRPAPGARP